MIFKLCFINNDMRNAVEGETYLFQGHREMKLRI